MMTSRGVYAISAMEKLISAQDFIQSALDKSDCIHSELFSNEQYSKLNEMVKEIEIMICDLSDIMYNETIKVEED